MGDLIEFYEKILNLKYWFLRQFHVSFCKISKHHISTLVPPYKTSPKIHLLSLHQRSTFTSKKYNKNDYYKCWLYDSLNYPSKQNKTLIIILVRQNEHRITLIDISTVRNRFKIKYYCLIFKLLALSRV